MSEGDPLRLLAPSHEAAPIVVHVPHSATALPADARRGIRLSDAELHAELRAMTDHLTDRLARDVGVHGATRAVNRWSRLAVDPERFLDPDREEMEAVGMGAVYTRTSDGRVLRELRPGQRERLLARYFHPYHAALADLVGRQVEQHGCCVIVDLHSYPRLALPYELHATGPRPQVDIGTDAQHTPAWLRAAVIGVVREAGFTHAVDTPFAGSFVPSGFLGDPRVSSVMLELRRDTYLDEATAAASTDEPRVRQLVTDVVGRIAAALAAGRTADARGTDAGRQADTRGTDAGSSHRCSRR